MTDSTSTSAGAAAQGYDDVPLHTDKDLPVEMRAPLAVFQGAEPPAPPWFEDALAQAPERRFVESLGSKIELLTWGELGRPGLLLVHGNSAHADWWSHIAPFLAQDFRVAAMSLAGMGDSDWRPRYGFDDFAADALACVQAGGLDRGGDKPLYIGHSFGGSQVFYAAATYPERMRGAILIDCGLGDPPPEAVARRAERAELQRRDPEAAANKVYATLPEALARFRLMPPQVCGELCVADMIARNALRQAPMRDGSGRTGWTWKFDPLMWIKLDRSGFENLIPTRDVGLRTPIAHILGDRSGIISRRVDGELGNFPPGTPEVVIPDSAHHIMVDQPLALVAALRALLATWPA